MGDPCLATGMSWRGSLADLSGSQTERSSALSSGLLHELVMVSLKLGVSLHVYVDMFG
jgi:hypothetical protein